MIKYHKVELQEATDSDFYGAINLYLNETKLNKYYNAFRNYLTKKTYSTNKIKLNFGNSSFLTSWSKNYDNFGGVIFKKNNEYYLGIINGKGFTKYEVEKLQKISTGSVDFGKKLVHEVQRISNKNPPRLFIRSKKGTFSPMVRDGIIDPNSILEIYDKQLFKNENKI